MKRALAGLLHDLGHPAPTVMPSPTPLALPIDRARAAWLGGDPVAWVDYRQCLRQAAALAKARPDRPRAERRPARARVRARA